MNEFERGQDPKKVLGLGRAQYCKNIYSEFMPKVRKKFVDVLWDYSVLNTEEGFIAFELDAYTENGMYYLQLALERLCKKKKWKDRMAFVDDDFMTSLWGENWPDEHPFYNEECIFVKIL